MFAYMISICLFLLTPIFSHVENTAGPEILCPDMPLFDEDFCLEVVGLKPRQVVVIEASWVDIDRVQWISECLFQADETGIVKLCRDKPLSGSYDDVDHMGLFWSMEMRHIIPPREEEVFPCTEVFCLPHVIKVFDGKRQIASKTVCRAFMTSQVRQEHLYEGGLVGTLFLPPLEKPSPLVIVLTGSNGGVQAGTASLFASRGIPALALAYSGAENLPPKVHRIPLEYFEEAFRWVDNHPMLSGEIFLHGTSRGAELALLLGSMFPERIGKIVARAPSSVVLSKESWTYEGKVVLPAAPFLLDVNNDVIEDQQTTKEKPLSIRVYRERGYQFERESFERASIPVENIRCPLLLISGEDDQIGPTSLYAKQILDRLDRFDSPIERMHLEYPNAGHLITMPYFPRVNVFCSDGVWTNYGGTPRGDEEASRDSWKQTLEFLQN